MGYAKVGGARFAAPCFGPFPAERSGSMFLCSFPPPGADAASPLDLIYSNIYNRSFQECK